MAQQAGLKTPASDQTTLNRLTLSAALLQRDALRYTPAGMPICQALLEHLSEQSEMGQQRTVRLVIAARFSGPLADRIARESLDASLSVTGFLCPKKLFKDNKPSGSLQLHVTDYQALSTENHS